MFINKNHIAFAEGLNAGIIADSRGHGYDFLIRNLSKDHYLIMSDNEDGADSPSPDCGDCHSTEDGDPMQWLAHVNLNHVDEDGDDETITDGIFTGTTSECLQWMAEYKLMDGSVMEDGSIRSGFMIVQFNTKTGVIEMSAHDGETTDTFPTLDSAQAVIDRWFEDYGDDKACYMIVAYTNEKQRQIISDLTV